MQEWLVAVCSFGICIAICFVIEIIKKTIKCIASKKGKYVDFSKFEYVLSGSAIALTFGGVFAFLYFVPCVPDYSIADILKVSAVVSGCTQSIYIGIVQTSRKGIDAVVILIKKIFLSINKKESLKQNVDNIADSVKNNNEDSNISIDDFIKNIGK